MKKKNESIVVCVTPQSSCKRLIEAGAKLCEEQGLKLRVISVLSSPGSLDALGELYECVEKLGADMDIWINGEPALTAAVAAVKFGAKEIITGFPGEKSSKFIADFHDIVPDIPVRMIDAAGNQYRIVHCTEKDIEEAKALSVERYSL